MFASLSANIYHIRVNLKKLEQMMHKCSKMEEVERAQYYFEEIRPQMDAIRERIDTLETMMPDEVWNLPKYREMLFMS
jgi:glutamine synthetase